jgi:hypothetical protein
MNYIIIHGKVIIEKEVFLTEVGENLLGKLDRK